MAIKILFDANNRPIEPTLLLANKNGNILGLITNVSELRVTDNLASVSRMSFKVTKYYDNQKCNVWDDLVDFKLVYCIEWDTWFEATLSLNESNEIIKIVDCAALSEAELSQTNLYGYEINTESDIAREDYKNPTIIYNPEDHSSSLIHRILIKAPHYTIKHIDATLARIQRTFSFDSISILDAFNRIAEEIGCIFIYGNESVKENGMRHPARTVSLYDLQQNCNDCGYRGEFTDVCPVCGSKNIKYGYGKDTTIFVNRDNLTDSIDFSVDTDSVKNCFRLEAGDDLMTATIINCNPNGTQYMWYISDAVKADMPKTLVDRINQYDKEYQFFNEKYQMNLSLSAINDYNRLVDKYLIYDSSIKKVPTSIVGYPSLMQSVYDVIDFEIILSESLMPKISMDKVTAQGQADLLTAASLSPVAVTNIKALSKTSADSNILAVAKIIVDSRYRVKIKESSFDTDSKVWVGNFSVTSYSDETDTAVSQTISVSITDDYEQYVKQKLDKALKKGDTTDYSISGIFKRDIIISGTNYGGDFVTTLQKYSLSMLEIIHDCCRGCIDVLIEQGISDRSKQSIETGNLYDKFYHNYYHRLKAIEKEMSVRQSEIDTIHTLMNEIEKERTKIQSQLNFQDYLGDENWKIFSSYRREDKYSNHNFISDGLNNTQLFNNALDFLGKAQEELYKSATLQHIISAPLKNLLVIKEFSPLVDYFEVGNWIRIEVDGEIYKLRLLNYSIDFDNLENIDVEFSDVCSTRSGISDLSSLYKKMTSISTSYDYYEKQAEKGSSSYETLNDFYLKGLDATLVKLVNNADDQDVVFDRHGMLFRQKDDVTNDFLPTQLKIVNSTLAVTNDNWETAKTGVGKFIYFDPRDFKYKEGFGIIADTLVGDVILSSEVGIFNDECSIALDKNGFTLTTNTIGKNVFTIQKETVDAKGNKIYDRQLYINDNGDIVLGGDASISWENITGTNHIWDTIDGKAQIFTTIPVPPYHVGDLWFGGVDKDIMTCVSTRLSGEYVDTDWERLNKYTDDSSVENVKHNLGYTYIDGKYVISPHIVGGDLTIGNVNGTYAKIDSNGILTAKGANISGTIYATDGEFSGKVVAKSGSFHGSVYATDGVFNGTVYATDGKFSGDIDASTITAFKKYTLYNGNSTSDIAYFDGKALNLGLLYTAESSPMDQGQSVGFQMTKNNRIIDVYGDMNFYQGNINTPGEIEAKMITAKNIYEMGLDGNLYTFIRSGETGNYQEIKYNNNTSFLFDHQGYGHTHTIIANSGGTKAIAIGDGVNAPVAGDEEWCILPYNITATKDSYSGQSEIATIGRDRSGTMNIGYDGYRFNCLYIKSINLNGDERSAWPSGGSSGTSNYNNLTNKPSINGNVLTGNNTSDDLGLASKSHSHSNYLTSSSLSGYATTSQLGNYYTKSETYTKSEVNNLVQNSGGSSSAPSLVTVSDGGVRPPISTGTGATQKVAYITANDTKKLTVKAQFGSTGYTNMNVALATSDQRLKCNIKESQISGLDAINAIKLREFDWVQTGKHQEIGVIADELEIIDKNLTFGGGYDEYGDMNIKGVDSFYLQGYEIKAIQELSQINEIQEKEVQELKNMILQLQGEISILKQKAIP